MNNYDKRLIERLRNWEKVYPEDEDKPEGNLYLEAAEKIVELLKNQDEEDETEKVNPHIGSLFSDLQAGLKEALEHEEGKETSIQIHQVQDFRFRATTDNKATTEITELPKDE
jgi:flagellin-specific chaperone FliS